MKNNDTVERNLLDNKRDVDTGLVAMFIRLSPEQRLEANDNAVRAILELRNGFKQTAAS